MSPTPRSRSARGVLFPLLLSILFLLKELAASEFVCGGFGGDLGGHTRYSNHVAAKVAGPAQEVGRQGVGALSALVIFARFSDEAQGDNEKPIWADDLFDAALPGSFSHFYNEMSRGQLQVGGQVLSKRYSSLSASSAYIADEPGTTGKFATFNLEILEQADGDVDMGLFDNDGPDRQPNSGDDDGYVDVVFINLLTVPRDFFIGGATGFGSLGLETDFISDDAAAGGGQIRVRSRYSGFGGTTQRGHVFTVTAGTMCHEFGHVLGLPDLFDQSTIGADSGEFDPVEDSAGIGKWGLMGLGTLGWGVEDGPNAFSAWSLAQLGWVGLANADLVHVTESMEDVAIEQIDRGGKVYQIPVSLDEYYLIENRQSDGSYYNRNIPGSGLLLWHVDERSDNDEETHKQLDLVCADGSFSEGGFPGVGEADPASGGDNLDFWASDAAYASDHNGNRGDATDPFDGVRFTRFSAETNPGARAYTGASRNLQLGFALEDIRDEGGGVMGVGIHLRQPLTGHISSDEVWSGTVSIDGDIVIEPGATLTIESGTTVQFARGDATAGGFDSARSELIAFGDLVVGGDAASPVLFQSAEERPRSTDWGGLLLMSGQAPGLEAAVRDGTVSLSHSRFGLLRSRLPPGITVWTSTRDVPWDTVIPAGAELVIDAGSTVRFGADDLGVRGRNPVFVELIVEGRLSVQGSATSRATMTVGSSDPQKGWFGIVMEEGSAIEASNLVIERAAVGIFGEVSASGALALSDSRIQGTGRGISVTVFGEATVDRTVFEFITRNAVRAQGVGILRLRNSTLSSIGLDGISLGNCSLEAINTTVSQTGILDPSLPASGLVATGGNGQAIELWNCTLSDNTLNGIQLAEWTGRVELHGCEIAANEKQGVVVDAAELVVFEDNRVERNLGGGASISAATVEIWTTDFADNIGPGLTLAGGGGVIEMSSFRNGTGLRLIDGADVILRRNNFLNGSLALESVDSQPVVQGNRFERNLTAIRVSGGRVPAAIRGNVFEDNSTAIQNLSSQTLVASGNYWGAADSAAIAEQLDGDIDWVPALDSDPSATAVSVAAEPAPREFALDRSSPNPFNGSARLSFDVPVREVIQIDLYDILGQHLRTLVSAEHDPGRYATFWDGRDGDGRSVGTGLYLYRMRAGDFVEHGPDGPRPLRPAVLSRGSVCAGVPGQPGDSLFPGSLS